MLAAGKSEQLTGQAFAAFGGCLYGLDCQWQFRIEQALEGLRVAADNHQKIVEVVRDASGQFADRLQFLRHRELFARLYQLLLGIAPLCGVADDTGKTDQIAVIVAHRGERAGREKRRAALPDAPTLYLVLAVLDGQFERAVRLAGAALVRSIQYAKMLTDDFVGLVTDDVLRSGVPAGNMSGRVEQENGARRLGREDPKAT